MLCIIINEDIICFLLTLWKEQKGGSFFMLWKLVMIFIVILIIKSIDKKNALRSFFLFFSWYYEQIIACSRVSRRFLGRQLIVTHRQKRLKLLASCSSSSSFTWKMVRRLRSHILIDYTGMCVKREREA